MKSIEFLKQLKGTELSKRTPIIQQYLRELPEEDIKRYKKFYNESISSLEEKRGVTLAETDLFNKGHLMFSFPYSLIHQIACIAKGEEIRTPKKEMQEREITRESPIKKNKNQRLARRVFQKFGNGSRRRNNKSSERE